MLIHKIAGRTGAVVLALAIGVTSLVSVPKPVSACENFVGGVCLDAKKKPQVKKKVRKKKAVKKKKPAVKKKAVVRNKTARQCISIKEKPGLLRRWGDRRISYTFTNSCAKSVKLLMISNPCYKPRGHFEKTRSVPRWKTEVGAKKRKTVSVVQSEKLYKSRAKGIEISYIFSNDPKAARAGYPKWKASCTKAESKAIRITN